MTKPRIKSTQQFSPWPPPKDQRLGVALASRIVKWAKPVMADLMVEAERMIRAKYLTAEIVKKPRTVKELSVTSCGFGNEGRVRLGSIWGYVDGRGVGEVEVWVIHDGSILLNKGIGLYEGDMWNRW